MEVEILKAGQEKEWDNFIESNPLGRFISQTQFKEIIEKAYNLKGVFLYVSENSQILAVLPFFLLKNLFNKKIMVSVVFNNYGGVLFGVDLTYDKKIEILKKFTEFLKRYAIKERIDYFEMHNEMPDKEIIKKFYLLGRQYPVAVLKLDRPFNDLFRQVFDYQIRKAVNKAIQNKVTVKESNSWDFVEKKFFPLYLKYEKRKHGSPAHSLNFFKQFYLIAPDNFRIFYAEYDNKIIASLFGIFNKSRVQILYNPSLEAFLNLRANDLIHSEFIKWACENGKKYFDFGPVRYEGQKRYKIKWGADLLDWGYYYLSGKKKNIVNVFVDSNFIKIISFVWKNFLPLPMAKILGPYIRKRLGQ